jgi:sulfur relay (sulfurtransferase) complex TusBCD TusD component (DsrE family)
MKLGIIISTNEPETVGNAYRLANFSLKEGDSVKIFLLAKGVESEIGSEKYDVKEQISSFLGNGGEILACGTCMKSRQMDSKETCPLSSMKDLYEMIKDSDKVLTFG